MSRLFEILRVRPGEQRISALLVGLMLFTAAGAAVGGNAIEALFFARFGVELLPGMYIILGLFTFVTSMAITALMGRTSVQRLYVALPFLLGFTLVGEWLILFFNFKWFFAVMWLGMNVINSLQGLLTWGLAGIACDTRQAKRLFPLFGAGGILGTVLGGLITQPLANWLHSENLLLVWAGALFISFFLGRALTRNTLSAPLASRAQQPGVITEMQRGYQFVRRSAIMQLVSYSAVLFSICYFSLALPFSRAATAQFPDADRLAGFLGLFQSLNTGLALLVSLFLANRLFARFGIMPMLLLFPVIYLAGFGLLAIYAPFALLVIARFAQMAWMNGIAGTAWQALFNVVPPEQRDRVRAFVGGVPEQAGTFLAGLILLVGEQALSPRQLYLVGFFAAALLVYILWRASQAYGQALVEALHAGQPRMFISEEQPFGGLQTDAGAVSVAVQGLNDPDAGIRRVSAEILGNLPVPEAGKALLKALADPDVQVRVSALQGLASTQSTSALSEISARLSDPEPEVRYQAIDSLSRLAASPIDFSPHINTLLSDADLQVRIRAAQALLQASDHPQAASILHKLAVDGNPVIRAQALTALGCCREMAAFDLAASALADAQPVVRKAACQALVALDPHQAPDILIRHLDDGDSSVRQALADAFGKIGEPALAPLLQALSNPACEAGALMALEHLPVLKEAPKIRAHAQNVAQTARYYHGLESGLAEKFGRKLVEDERMQLLLESLHNMAQHNALNALWAVGLLSGGERVRAALENLGSREAAQRANALEALESAGEREIVRPLLVLWESGESSAAPLSEGWAQELLSDPNAWIRACALLVVAAGMQVNGLRERMKSMSLSDPDPFVRNVAENVLLGDSKMDTLATLSLMERILFLRRVPLFAGLPPADLKQVASIAGEVFFEDGEALAQQGEAGSELFIIVSGNVRVLMTTASQKEPRQVASRTVGDYLGEMAIISQEPRSATLIADGAVRALSISHKQFEGILRERPEISLAMLRILGHRLKEANQKAIEE
jgi:HEAT repeat protein